MRASTQRVRGSSWSSGAVETSPGAGAPGGRTAWDKGRTSVSENLAIVTETRAAREAVGGRSSAREQHARAHLGVRTETHKLIHYWKKDQWECYDLVKDPNELRNICADPASQEVVAGLKTELLRLKKEMKDEDQFAGEMPPAGVDGQPAK